MSIKILLILTSIVLVNCLQPFNEDEARWMDDTPRKYIRNSHAHRHTLMTEDTRRQQEQMYQGEQDMGNREAYHGNNLQYLTSQEEVGSYEIRHAQRQYHDTDPEAAGNGRLIHNQIQSRRQKVLDETEHSQDEINNKIYKDEQ